MKFPTHNSISKMKTAIIFIAMVASTLATQPIYIGRLIHKIQHRLIYNQDHKFAGLDIQTESNMSYFKSMATSGIKNGLSSLSQTAMNTIPGMAEAKKQLESVIAKLDLLTPILETYKSTRGNAEKFAEATKLKEWAKSIEPGLSSAVAQVSAIPGLGQMLQTAIGSSQVLINNAMENESDFAEMIKKAEDLEKVVDKIKETIGFGSNQSLPSTLTAKQLEEFNKNDGRIHLFSEEFSQEEKKAISDSEAKVEEKNNIHVKVVKTMKNKKEEHVKLKLEGLAFQGIQYNPDSEHVDVTFPFFINLVSEDPLSKQKLEGQVLIFSEDEHAMADLIKKVEPLFGKLIIETITDIDSSQAITFRSLVISTK